MAAAAQPLAAGLVLVGGHESDGGRDLWPLPATIAGVPVQVAAAGRTLAAALAEAAPHAGAGRPLVVVPMTLGRDPRLVSDTARTVRWAARGDGAGRFALAPPFGTADHLVGWLRAACRRRVDGGAGDGAAVLVAAAAADPFDDAELHRVVALVRAHSPQRLVEVGLRDGPGGGLEAGVERCRRLGAERVTVVAAGFGQPPDVDVPLLTAAATAQVVAARAASACQRLLAHGDDGVTAALAADHAHGFAHSHEHAHGHSHDHEHHHPHSHAHANAG